MIKRYTPLAHGLTKLNRTPIRRQSKKKSRDMRKYLCAKAEHFALHPRCQHPDGCTKSLLKGDLIDLHHRAGRNSVLLYAKQYFATACRFHHDKAKSEISASRANGWIVDVPSDEVRRLREAEL